MTTLALTPPTFEPLRSALDDEAETAWVLIAREASGGLLLGRELIAVPPEAYLKREPARLKIASSGFVPAFKRALADRAVPVFVHTHPDGSPESSRLDLRVDEQLRGLAVRRGCVGYGALILGGRANAPRIGGMVWLRSDGPSSIERVRVAGTQLRVLIAEGSRDDGACPGVFDRQVRAFGADGQRILRALRIGVVGAGGTGSPTIEQLARLGVGTIICYDDDTVDQSNLTRIHQSSSRDIGALKVTVAKRSAEACGTATTVRARESKVTTAAAVAELATCDLVFGCTDDQAGRLVLSRLAYHYLVPVIDCGVSIQADDGVIRDITGRITYMAPGTPCLICRGQVNVLAAGQQMRSAAEQHRLANEGYAPQLEEAAPAVVAFTTAVSALAINELLARLFGYGDETPGQLLVRFGSREIRRAGHPGRPGHSCSDPKQWGLGDTSPTLGILGLT